MAKPAQYALTVVASPELVVAKSELKKLEAAAVAQFTAIAQLETQTAVAAIITGGTLHRVKNSLPHGKFDGWKVSNLTKGNIWTEATAKKNASYYMRLFLSFVEKTRVTDREVLAMPTDSNGALKIDGSAAGKKLAAALHKFVGDQSLNELLIKYCNKGVGLRSELMAGDEDDAGQAPAAANAGEQLWLELWQAAQQGRDPNQLQHLKDEKKIETLIGELQETERALKARLAALRAQKS